MRTDARLRWVVALVALSALEGCLVDPFEASCGDAAGCDDCLARSGCGFCSDGADGGACMPGTSVGPTGTGAACPSERWWFSQCGTPPAPSGCAAESSCHGCLFSDGCGWCVDTNECRDLASPEGCTLLTDSSRCQEFECWSEETCGDCHAAGCVWCDALFDDGRVGGCLDSGVTCPLVETYFEHELCPPPNRCAAARSCSDCAAMPGCGYCTRSGSSGQCMSTTASLDHCSDYWIDSTFDCP